MTLHEEFQKELSEEISKALSLEDQLDALRLFKKTKVQKIQQEDISQASSLPETFFKLSTLADVILSEALLLVETELHTLYGYPAFIDNDGNIARSEFAVVGMGKLGGQEIHYGSDLDLIFLYSRNGNTQGRKSITHREYYARLAQKLISYLSVPTVQGFAYKIDTQLRPSGNQGTLVSSLDAYADYQRNMAQPWEKQALLKARVVAGDPSFGKSLKKQFLTFIFSKPFSPRLHEEIHQHRLRMEQEIARETPRRLHYKHGFGGLTDIEFSIQYLQLKMGKIFEGILTGNTLKAIELMGEKSLLKKEEYEILKNAWLFYRLLELRMELKFDLKEGYIDPQSAWLDNLAETMGEASGLVLLNKFNETRQQVRRVYLRILQKEDE